MIKCKFTSFYSVFYTFYFEILFHLLQIASNSVGELQFVSIAYSSLKMVLMWIWIRHGNGLGLPLRRPDGQTAQKRAENGRKSNQKKNKKLNFLKNFYTNF